MVVQKLGQRNIISLQRRDTPMESSMIWRRVSLGRRLMGAGNFLTSSSSLVLCARITERGDGEVLLQVAALVSPAEPVRPVLL